MIKVKKRYLQVIISLVLLIFLSHWVDFSKVKESLVHANYFLLFLAFLMVAVNRVIMACKWNLLLRVKKIYVSWFDIIRIYYIANFLGIYMPATVGIDVVRSYYVARKKYSVTDILSSIFVERFIGFNVLFVFGLLGIIIFYDTLLNSELESVKLFSFILFLTVIGFGGFFLSLNDKVGSFFIKFCDKTSNKKKIGKIVQKLSKLYKSYLHYKSEKKILFVFFLLTCLELFTYIIRSFIVATALHISIPFFYFFAFLPIILVLIRLPISLHGFGINEGGFVYFLSLIGIPKALGFSIGLIDHFIILIGILPGALFYALDRPGKKIVSTEEIQIQESKV